MCFIIYKYVFLACVQVLKTYRNNKMLSRYLMTIIQIDDSLDPTDVVRHFGVDSKFAAFTAAFAETRDAKDGPFVVYRAEEGTARVAGAGIDPPFTITSAKHVVRDEIVLVDLPARRRLHYGNLHETVRR